MKERRLLPQQPRLVTSTAQLHLTQRYLMTALPELEAFFLATRGHVDPPLQLLQPVKLGKPYPLGQCLEITLAVEKLLRCGGASTVRGMAADGRRAFSNFLRAGGVFRQVWGDLRGQFFQNAFQLGTLYVDVSNDTVTPTKPKVEILPFDQADFVPIADFQHFIRIAERYWQHRIFPNHVLPELAPYCPLVHIDLQGVISFRDATNYMLAMATTGRFQGSEEVLRKLPLMQPELFVQVTQALHGAKLNVAMSPEAGREQALRMCREYRAKRWYALPAQTATIISAVKDANLRLVRWHLSSEGKAALPALNQPHLQEKIPMSTISIDNVDYDINSLSDEAKAQLQSIQFVDQELARLQAHTAAMQTARNAYVSALKAALPTPALSV